MSGPGPIQDGVGRLVPIAAAAMALATIAASDTWRTAAIAATAAAVLVGMRLRFGGPIAAALLVALAAVVLAGHPIGTDHRAAAPERTAQR